MSCVDISDAVGAAEMALDDCLQATELFPGKTLCLPVEVLSLWGIQEQNVI